MDYKITVEKNGDHVSITLPTLVVKGLEIQQGDEILITNTSSGEYKITKYSHEHEIAMRSFTETRNKYDRAFQELAE